jgi:uncharacterized protein YprB with RNaseH-like and TPR domain
VNPGSRFEQADPWLRCRLGRGMSRALVAAPARLPGLEDHGRTEIWVGEGPDRYLRLETRYAVHHRHGDGALSDLLHTSPRAVGLLAGRGECAIRPEQCLFLDTETTGLSGGAGTMAFLVGCAFLEGNAFVARLFFIPDFPAEKSVMAELSLLFERFPCLVTFNGKTFDVPLLQSRFRMHRKKLEPSAWYQVDLLHISRTLWKKRLGRCPLSEIERSVLGVRRHHDVPSSQIPGVYFDYLRGRNLARLRPVFDHNAWDLLTSARLLIEAGRILGGSDIRLPPGTGNCRPSLSEDIDHLRLARWYLARGEPERALLHCAASVDWNAKELEGRIRRRLERQQRAKG